MESTRSARAAGWLTGLCLLLTAAMFVDGTRAGDLGEQAASVTLALLWFAGRTIERIEGRAAAAHGDPWLVALAGEHARECAALDARLGARAGTVLPARGGDALVIAREGHDDAARAIGGRVPQPAVVTRRW